MIGRTLMLFFSLSLTFLNTSVWQVVSIGESDRMQSNQVSEDRECKVHLPDSYKWTRDRHDPVLYVLDGDSHLLHSAASVEFLSAQREIPETIVVAIASTARVRDFTQRNWTSHWIGCGADALREPVDNARPAGCRAGERNQ